MTTDIAEHVFESIHSVMHLYRARQYQASKDSGHELTHMENKVLGFVARHPGATQRDLAEHYSRDKAQLARLIKTLREKALLRSEVSESDRRSVRLALTAAGEAVHRAVLKQGRQLNDAAVSGMSREQCETLVDLLGSITRNLSRVDS